MLEVERIFSYCFEPGDHRMELSGDTGSLIFDPDRIFRARHAWESRGSHK